MGAGWAGGRMKSGGDRMGWGQDEKGWGQDWRGRGEGWEVWNLRPVCEGVGGGV